LTIAPCRFRPQFQTFLTLQRKLIIATQFFESFLSVALASSMISGLNGDDLFEHGLQTVFFHWQQ